MRVMIEDTTFPLLECMISTNELPFQEPGYMVQVTPLLYRSQLMPLMFIRCLVLIIIQIIIPVLTIMAERMRFAWLHTTDSTWGYNFINSSSIVNVFLNSAYTMFITVKILFIII